MPRNCSGDCVVTFTDRSTELCRRGIPTLCQDTSNRRIPMSTRELRTRGGFLLPALLPLLFLAVPVFARSGDYYGPLYTSSEQIEAAQRILQGEKDLKPGGYTVGQMDQATIDAIRTFQRDHFIPNSGLLDHETFAQ